jgi:hypothetical protein
MNTKPKVSIIIPVYNGSDYLKEAIDSAVGQTSKDVEVIVVNDGSNDGDQTEAIAKSYGDKIRYLYKENGGVASALNLGIKTMRGEWFAWLSHDDVFSTNRIESDLIFLEKAPEVKVVFCKSTIIDSQGEIVEDINYPIEQVNNCRDALLLGGVDMCTMTIHKSCFEKTGLFNEYNKTTQDVEMTLRLSSIFPFYFNRNSVTFKREHLNRGTYTLSEVKKQDLGKLCDFIHNELSLNNFFPNLSGKDEHVADAWIYMGNMYSSFGAAHYAEECYKLAILANKNILYRWMKMLKFNAQKLNNPIINKLLKRL